MKPCDCVQCVNWGSPCCASAASSPVTWQRPSAAASQGTGQQPRLRHLHCPTPRAVSHCCVTRSVLPHGWTRGRLFVRLWEAWLLPGCRMQAAIGLGRCCREAGTGRAHL